MSGPLFALSPTAEQDDPYNEHRHGFAITMPHGAVVPPLALAIHRLPAHDWAHDAGRRRWWVAEEHLPVLRRYVADFDLALPRSA
jgi:hypothetical protein